MTNKTKKNNKKGKQENRVARVQPFGTAPLFPSSRRIKLAYAERIAIVEEAANAGNHHVFQLNSLFDPNSSGVGAQPVGFDQIMASYGQFRVWGVKVRISYENKTSGDGGSAGVCSMFGAAQAVAPANPNSWACQPYGKSKVISRIGSVSGCVLEQTFSLPAVLGLTPAQYAADMDFVGTAAGNPTRSAYLILGYLSVTGAVIGGVDVYVQMEFEAEFSFPFNMNMS